VECLRIAMHEALNLTNCESEHPKKDNFIEELTLRMRGALMFEK
jgi:hypothetical protein